MITNMRNEWLILSNRSSLAWLLANITGLYGFVLGSIYEVFFCVEPELGLLKFEIKYRKNVCLGYIWC